MTKKQLQHFEQRLLEERAKLVKDIGQLEETTLQASREGAGMLNAYSFHMADAGTDANEREKAFHLASRDTRLIYHIDQALERIHKGEYGSCEVCTESINPQRLDVVPHARLCVDCKEKEDLKNARRTH